MTWLQNFGLALPVGLCGGVGRLESHVMTSKLKSQVRLPLSGVRLPFGAGTACAWPTSHGGCPVWTGLWIYQKVAS